MSYLAAVDVGASEIKAAIFDTRGREICIAHRDCPTTSPEPGWAELPGEVLLRWPLALLREAVQTSGLDPAAIKAIGVTGSRATILPVGVGGKPVGPAILWYDRRASTAVEELASRLAPQNFFDVTGVPLDPTPSVTKMMWLRAEQPQMFAAARVFALPQTAALQALTGSGWYCDHSYGSYYGLMDLKTNSWSAELLQAAGIDERVLPRLVAPGTAVGQLSPAAAKETGLPAGVQVVASGSDAACFKLGAGLEAQGIASVYLGTAGAAGMITDHPVIDRRLTCCPAALPGYWDVDALLLTGGSAYRWVRDLIDDQLSFAKLDKLAAEVPPGSEGVVFIPNLAGAGTPLWDATATGIFSGLRLSHGPAHLARAVLEGVAFSHRHALEILQEAVAPIETLQFTGGGASSKLWAQMLADVTGFPMTVPSIRESTSLGAAMMASVAAGAFATHREAIEMMITDDDHYEPDPVAKLQYDAVYSTYRRILESM
jgi:xylulokinase